MQSLFNTPLELVRKSPFMVILLEPGQLLGHLYNSGAERS